MADTDPWPIAVFAYNEEELITGCLQTILDAAAPHPVRIFVLINGCRDNTEGVVREFAKTHPEVVPVPIKLGDKANAWNVYVHELAPKREVHFFIDGDMQIVPGSFAEIVKTFASHPKALAVAAVPAVGRTVSDFRRMIVEERVLAGNFYALSGAMVQRFRDLKVRLPIGMFGEDGLVGTLVRWNLDPLSKPDFERIQPCEQAAWRFESFTPFRPKHWRLYKNRMMRYAVRRHQAQMLYPRLWERGIAGMPPDVVTLYREEHKRMKLRWNGINTPFDIAGYFRIMKRMRAQPG